MYLGRGIRFESYLWGIETTNPKVSRQAERGVWIVPMRNWNYIPQSAYRGLFVCLNRTYEELKPEIKDLLESWDFRLNRTYEELKPRWSADTFWAHGVWIVPMRNWNLVPTHQEVRDKSCLNRTYEELKQCPWHTPYARRWVWIVPMRNWNTFHHEWYIIKTKFESYLWGIETQDR